MADSQMSEILRASLDGIERFTDTDTYIGRAIETSSGVTVIPVSRVTVAFATGGVDYPTKKTALPTNFGGGGGSGVTITPVAFLAVSPDAQIKMIPVGESGGSQTVGRVASFLEQAPEWIKKIKDSFQ